MKRLWSTYQGGRRTPGGSLISGTRQRGYSNALYGVLDYLAFPLGMLLSAPFLLRHLGASQYGVWLLAGATVSSGGIVSGSFGDAAIKICWRVSRPAGLARCHTYCAQHDFDQSGVELCSWVRSLVSGALRCNSYGQGRCGTPNGMRDIASYWMRTARRQIDRKCVHQYASCF